MACLGGGEVSLTVKASICCINNCFKWSIVVKPFLQSVSFLFKIFFGLSKKNYTYPKPGN